MAIQTKNLTDEQLDYLLASVEVMSYGDEVVLVTGYFPSDELPDQEGLVNVVFPDGSCEDLTYDDVRDDNSIFYITKPICFETLDNWHDTKGEIPDLFKKLNGFPIVY